MKSRLLRALQRGGCILETDDAYWSVWRSRDRRGRTIGLVPAAEVHMLILKGDLSPLGQCEDGRLVWSGPLTALHPTVSAAALVTAEEKQSYRRKSLLQRLLERVVSPRGRRYLARAALDFSEDIERAESGYRLRGMNWQAIRGGTRIQGGRAGGSVYQGNTALAAARRLAAISEISGPESFRLLERVIVEGATRHAISKWLNQRPADAERHALTVLRKLASIYANDLSLPQRSLPQSA